LRFNGGRTCLAPRRLIVAARVYASFIAALTRRLARLEQNAIEPELAARLAPLVAEAERRGARLLSGTVTACEAVGPCVLAGVEPRMAIVDTELFGPVALVMRAAGADDVIALANASRFGLGASVFGPSPAAREL